MTEQEKTVTEYRVVADRRKLGEARREPASVVCGSLAHAEARAAEMAQGTQFVRPYENIRIESRTVTYSPWEAVNQGD